MRDTGKHIKFPLAESLDRCGPLAECLGLPVPSGDKKNCLQTEYMTD